MRPNFSLEARYGLSKTFGDILSIADIAEELAGGFEKATDSDTNRWFYILLAAIRKGDLRALDDPDWVFSPDGSRHHERSYKGGIKVHREEFRSWWFTYNSQQPLPDFWFESEDECHQSANVRGAIRQHSHRNAWYKFMVEKASKEWQEGSGLRHEQMAKKLIQDAPEEISKPTLLRKLRDLLKELGRTDLIRGYKKK